MNAKKTLFSTACIIGIFSLMVFVIKDFNLSWVSVNNDTAKVTINFLMPMETSNLNKCVRVENDPVYDNHYSYDIEWLNEHTCEITLKEKSEIKGQKINLHIQDAPTKYAQITKDVVIPIQFKTKIQLLEPQEDIVVATDQPFTVTFNTPMREQQIHKYIESDGAFIIEPRTKIGSNDQVLKDLTTFQITPKVPLDNDKNYVISFREGMPSISGTLLEESEKVIITTDKKPQITSIVPADTSKWIGLYPRIIVESSTPMINAYVTLDNILIKGALRNEYSAVFYPSTLLKPSTTYNMEVYIESATGEKSDKENILFTTVPIKEDKLWIEILTEENQIMNVYKGQAKIKSFVCSTGSDAFKTPYGTYYTQEKKDSYVSNSYGANYCTDLTEGVRIHGLMRDGSWEVKYSSYSSLGKDQNTPHIILAEENAEWIFENVPLNTMVIIRPGNN